LRIRVLLYFTCLSLQHTVSQFTLHGFPKGNKIDFHLSMETDKAKSFYEKFVADTKKAYKADRVLTGVFGANMQVQPLNPCYPQSPK
jgi:D-Tyr-tRNAtyr deacylase